MIDVYSYLQKYCETYNIDLLLDSTYGVNQLADNAIKDKEKVYCWLNIIESGNLSAKDDSANIIEVSRTIEVSFLKMVTKQDEGINYYPTLLELTGNAIELYSQMQQDLSYIGSGTYETGVDDLDKNVAICLLRFTLDEEQNPCYDADIIKG